MSSDSAEATFPVRREATENIGQYTWSDEKPKNFVRASKQMPQELTRFQVMISTGKHILPECKTEESQEENRERWLQWPQREAKVFFMLENKKRFEGFCCLFLVYLVKDDL